VSTAVPAGVATGIGSMPGTDPQEAARIAVGETALPFLPELPARGPGADLVGRTAALLIDVPMDYVHRTYRLCTAPGSLMRTARDHLRWDLDALEEQWERAGSGAPALKVQACGPFTLAAEVELRGGHRIARDRGAVADVAASLAAGLAEHTEQLERRLGTTVLVQLDEPSIGAVLDGTVTPLTRMDPIRPIPAAEAAQTLQSMAATIGRPMLLHSCAPPRWELLELLDGFTLSLDMSTIGEPDFDALGGYLDGGGMLAAGIVPARDTARPLDPEQPALALARLIDRIGLPRRVLAENLLVTPACGLAGVGATGAAAALRTASGAARLLGDLSTD